MRSAWIKLVSPCEFGRTNRMYFLFQGEATCTSCVKRLTFTDVNIQNTPLVLGAHVCVNQNGYFVNIPVYFRFFEIPFFEVDVTGSQF